MKFARPIALACLMPTLAATMAASLTACQTGPSHIPPLHQIPGAAISSMIENTRYTSRRNTVKASIAPHVDVILTQADKGGGEAFHRSCHIARVSPQKCAALARQISQDAHIYRAGRSDERTEKLTTAFMVYGD